MYGEQSNEEKLQLEAKIKELTEELEQKTSTHNLLSLQLKRLQVRVCYMLLKTLWVDPLIHHKLMTRSLWPCSVFHGGRQREGFKFCFDGRKEAAGLESVLPWCSSLLHLFNCCAQDDVRRVKRELEASGSEKADMTSKIEELNLHNDSSQRELRVLTNKKKVRQTHNIQVLRLKRL